MNAGAIIPAAGSGRRMGGTRKAFLPVGGRPLLRHSLEVLQAHTAIRAIVVVLAREDVETPPDWLRDASVTLVAGGAERVDSVRAGLAALSNEIDAVVVHDAARPLITPEMIDRVLEEVRHGRSATVAVPVTDTLHQVDTVQEIRATPDRSQLWHAQTPQAFPREVLERAFALMQDGSVVTDEAGLVAGAGWPVRIVAGDRHNIKVTTPEDLDLVAGLLARKSR